MTTYVIARTVVVRRSKSQIPLGVRSVCNSNLTSNVSKTNMKGTNEKWTKSQK